MEKEQKKTARTPILGFYWRKFLFFSSFFAIALFIFIGIRPYKADVSSYTPGDYTNLNIALDVAADGSLQVDGQKIKDRVADISDGQEIRFPIIDNPKVGYASVQITMTLPKPVAYSSIFEIKGIHGVGWTNSYVQDNKTIIFEAENVDSTATLSVITKLPKNTIQQPLIFRLYSYLGSIKANSWLIFAIALPILTLLFMLIFIAYQIKHQRIELPTEETSSPPMALPPAIVGVLYRQKIGPREIAASIIDLALRGDIFIVDRERDFAFAKNRFDTRLLSFEKILLSKIFRENIVSDRLEIEERINNHLYSKKISLVTSGIYILATRLGYFKINPQKAHLQYRIIGIGGFFLGLAGFGLSLAYFTNPPYIAFFWVGMMASALVVAFTANNIPNRTALGREALSNWLAFRNYLSNPEKIKFSYENQELFHKYLPYAIVLDCEVAWAKRFSEHNFILPKWYISDRSGLGLQDFCLALFPLVSYVSRSLSAIREPGFE